MGKVKKVEYLHSRQRNQILPSQIFEYKILAITKQLLQLKSLKLDYDYRIELYCYQAATV